MTTPYTITQQYIDYASDVTRVLIVTPARFFSQQFANYAASQSRRSLPRLPFLGLVRLGQAGSGQASGCEYRRVQENQPRSQV